jgi:protein SCO1/2
MSGQKGFSRSEGHYRIPDVVLIDMHGEEQPFSRYVSGDEPVLLQFIFTTCTTICPVLSASFAAAQDDLAAAGPAYRMISISIDPEHDTPRRLREYADRFEARAEWRFLTGSWDTIATVQRAFDAYYPGNNKMYHRPYTFLRVGENTPWVRFEGFPGTADLVTEYRALLARRDQTD